MGICAIIFDFDGVILESVSIKSEAFRQLFAFVPEHVDEIIRFHKENGGMSRFNKFRYIYKNILHEDLTDERFRWLSDRFSGLVLEGILQAPFVDGAKEFIERCHRSLSLYVVSATPENELKHIVRHKGLEMYFRGVYGSPVTKEEHIRRIVRESGLDPGSVIYIGDAVNDWQAARAAGIRFFARVKPGDINCFEDFPGIDTVLHDLRDLARSVREDLC
jgi:phosphoglycolate phosphatase-like HAD superfamily hydrolase